MGVVSAVVSVDVDAVVVVAPASVVVPAPVVVPASVDVVAVVSVEADDVAGEVSVDAEFEEAPLRAPPKAVAATKPATKSARIATAAHDLFRGPEFLANGAITAPLRHAPVCLLRCLELPHDLTPLRFVKTARASPSRAFP